MKEHWEGRAMMAWVLLVVGFVFWLGETWWFGWNARPESVAEAVCDAVAVAMLWAGFVWMVAGDMLALRRRVEALEAAAREASWGPDGDPLEDIRIARLKSDVIFKSCLGVSGDPEAVGDGSEI